MKIVLANQFKNEENRLQEWLMYNKALGITDFILVNDHSTDKSLDIIHSIDGITVHILDSQYEEDKKFRSSVDTQKYSTGGYVARVIYYNFMRIHDFCLETYGKEVYLGFFDVDEFIFFDTSKMTLLELLEDNIKNYAAFCISSVEVNNDTFKVDGSWLTLQNYLAISLENQQHSTRGSTIKSFQNLSYPDLTVFKKYRNIQPDPIGMFVHCGGVDIHNLKYCDRELCSFLHFRSPMYDPHINRKLCNKNYDEVKQISIRAKNGK